MCEYKDKVLAKQLQAKPFFRSHVEAASDTSYNKNNGDSVMGSSSLTAESSSSKSCESNSNELSMPILRYVLDRWQNDPQGQLIAMGWAGAIAAVSLWGIYQKYRSRVKLAELRGENSGFVRWEKTKQIGRSDDELDERLKNAINGEENPNDTNASTSETSSEMISSEEIHEFNNHDNCTGVDRISHSSRMSLNNKEASLSADDEVGATRRILRLANTPTMQRWSLLSHPFTMLSSAVMCLVWQVFRQSRMNDENGHLGELVVSRRWDAIPEATMRYAYLSVEASLAGAAASLCTGWLSQSLRSNLSKTLQRKYGGHLIHVLPRVTEVQSRLTKDIRAWSVLMATVLTGVVKPLVSLGLCTGKLTGRIGWRNFLQCVAYSIVSGMWVRSFVSPNTTHSRVLAESEAMYYSGHSRLIEFAEEIDLMKGISAEMHLLRNRLSKLDEEQTSESIQHFLFDTMQNYFVRYLGVLVAFITLLPMAADEGGQVTEPTEFLLNSLHDLINLGLSLRDLALVFGKVRELKGLSIRIDELNRALTEELESARNSILSRSNECISYVDATGSDEDDDDDDDDFKDEEEESVIMIDGNDGNETGSPNHRNTTKVRKLRRRMDSRGVEMMQAGSSLGKRHSKGKVLLSLINVSVYKPNVKILCNHDEELVRVSEMEDNGNMSDDNNMVDDQPRKLLLKNLSLDIIKGENVMIEGPNGCGKSSLIRAISGIWKYSGLIKFSDSLFECDRMMDAGGYGVKSSYDVMFVPQRSYLVPRLSIRDQLMYPLISSALHSSNNNNNLIKSITDDQIIQVLNEFNLGQLLLDEHGLFYGLSEFDDDSDGENREVLNQGVSHVFWDRLSPGQQQCVCLCRVLLRQPKIVFLDECCSAVSDSLTQRFYRELRRKEITAVSVTHDSSLLKYHSTVVKFEQDSDDGSVSHSVSNRDVIAFA